MSIIEASRFLEATKYVWNLLKEDTYFYSSFFFSCKKKDPAAAALDGNVMLAHINNCDESQSSKIYEPCYQPIIVQGVAHVMKYRKLVGYFTIM
jgi:hypothetical protein